MSEKPSGVTVVSQPSRHPPYAANSPPSAHPEKVSLAYTPIEFNPLYIKQLDGIVKIVQIVFGFIAICCVAEERINLVFSPRGSHADTTFVRGGRPFFLFVSILALLTTLALFIFHLLSLSKNIKLPWTMIELVFNIVVAVFYLIASIVVFVQGAFFDPYIVAGAFGVIITTLYGISAFFAFKALRAS